MLRYFIQLAYNGTHYNGWQIQENTPHTVQQALQDKLSMILGETIEMTGCGRTDTGVHARDFFAHFDSKHEDLAERKEHFIYKFNQVLPGDIAIKDIHLMNDSAHSRFDALDRTYYYFLHQYKNPFLETSSYYYHHHLDFDLMNQAASFLLEAKDFTSFSKVNTQTKTNDCDVTEAQWVEMSEGEWVFIIKADRFLRNMVRAIVGTLLDVGRKKINLEEFKQIIEQKNRSEAGMSVPAHALYLVHITYPENIFI